MSVRDDLSTSSRWPLFFIFFRFLLFVFLLLLPTDVLTGCVRVCVCVNVFYIPPVLWTPMCTFRCVLSVCWRISTGGHTDRNNRFHCKNMYRRIIFTRWARYYRVVVSEPHPLSPVRMLCLPTTVLYSILLTRPRTRPLLGCASVLRYSRCCCRYLVLLLLRLGSAFPESWQRSG